MKYERFHFVDYLQKAVYICALSLFSFNSFSMTIELLEKQLKQQRYKDFQYPRSIIQKNSDGKIYISDKVVKNLDQKIIIYEKTNQKLTVKKLIDKETNKRIELETYDPYYLTKGPTTYQSKTGRTLAGSHTKSTENDLGLERNLPIAKKKGSEEVSITSIGANSIETFPVVEKTVEKAKTKAVSSNRESSEQQNSDSTTDSTEDTTSADTSNDKEPANSSPEAFTDTFQVGENKTLTINIVNDLLKNDKDSDGDILRITNFETITFLGGTIVDQGDGTLIYTPKSDTSGDDYFKYTITDEKDFSSVNVEIEIVAEVIKVNRNESKFGVETFSDTISLSSAIEGKEDELYVAYVSFTDSTNFVTDINGLNLDWNLLKSQCSNKENVRIEVWYALGTPINSDTISADLSFSSDSGQIFVARYSGVDTDNPIELLASSNPLGVDTLATCGNPGTASKKMNINVTASVENGMIVSGMSFFHTNSHSPNLMSEVIDITSGSNPKSSGLVIQELQTTTQVNYTIDGELGSATKWGSIITLIKPRP